MVGCLEYSGVRCCDYTSGTCTTVIRLCQVTASARATADASAQTSSTMATSAYNSQYQERLCRVRGAANRLQSLNLLSGKETDNLPGIVVVGNQNVGKSALLEAISGVRLPSAANCCTKCPLMLEMHRSETTVMTVSYDHNGTKHNVDLTDLGDVTQAILNATNELTGNQGIIVNSMISVKVMTPTSPNLTLIDLPGLIGDAQAGMAQDTPQAIERMVNRYIKGKVH